MVIMKKTNRLGTAAKLATSFGAAMASLFVVNDLQAEEIDLTFFPGSIPPQSQFPELISITQLAMVFSQFNDTLGKTMSAYSLNSIGLVSPGAMLSPGTFVGDSSIDFSANNSSSPFVGFRSGNNVGWFQLDLGGLGGSITYIGGRFGTQGETVTVGNDEILLGDVNCDRALDLLDVQPFIQLLMDNEFLDKADINEDGEVNLLDVGPFIDALSGS